jgi:hypothetical protein
MASVRITVFLIVFLPATVPLPTVDADQLIEQALIADRTLGQSHLQSDRPLSLDEVVTWRRSHAGTRRDRVVHHPKDGVIVVSMTAEGSPREIELTLDAETHQVRRETLAVRDGVGHLGIDPLPHAGVASPAAPGYAAPGYLAPRTALQLPGIAGLTGSGRLDDLKARLRLGQTGADMRGAALTVTPMAVPRFALNDLLTRRFADERTRATFLQQLADSLGTVRRRLSLLTDLGQRYPDAGRRLSRDERLLFKRLVGLEYRKLCPELDELRQQLSALTGADDVSHPGKQPPAALVGRAPEALSRASSLERDMQLLLGHKDLTAADERRVRIALVSLWEAVHGQRAWRD